jgi:hypothetical protein
LARKINYKLVPAPDKSKYSVFETATEQNIKTFANFADARKFMRSLNLGNGFDGWTPTFLLQDFSTYINKPSKNM